MLAVVVLRDAGLHPTVVDLQSWRTLAGPRLGDFVDGLPGRAHRVGTLSGPALAKVTVLLLARCEDGVASLRADGSLVDGAVLR